MSAPPSDLATVALLGTARRRVGDVRLPAPLERLVASRPQPAEPARHLLDVAALATVYRRAGLRTCPVPPVTAAPTASPTAGCLADVAPDDPRPVVGAAASARLRGLLTGPARDRELLALWLTTAAQRGLRPPPQALPGLLDLAARSRDLAPAVFAATGARGRWLAAHRPHWAQAAGTMSSPPGSHHDPRGWDHGKPAERIAWLAALRAADPRAARDRLAAQWSMEAPGERVGLLGVLAEGLSSDDEPFIEGCLVDPLEPVRSLAARLLTRLPGSAHAQRLAERGSAAVRVERHRFTRRLVVTPPATGSLTEIVGSAPLATWIPALGRSPGEILSLDLTTTPSADPRAGAATGSAEALWAGWAAAATRERDPAWADALLDQLPPGSSSVTAAVPELLALLPEGDRGSRVGRLLTARMTSPLPPVALLRTVPAPWSPPLVAVVLGWLHRRPDLGDPESRGVLDLAARRLPAELAGAVRQLAGQWPERSPARRIALAAAELMTTRHDLIEELR